VDALCAQQGNQQITPVRRYARSVGEELMLLQVHRVASRVRQALIPDRRPLHACHALQDMQGYIQGHRAIFASLAHGVLKALARVLCVRQAHSAPIPEQNLSNAAPVPIQTRGNLLVGSVPVASLVALVQRFVLYAREAKHRMMEPLLANLAVANTAVT